MGVLLPAPAALLCAISANRRSSCPRYAWTWLNSDNRIQPRGPALAQRIRTVRRPGQRLGVVPGRPPRTLPIPGRRISPRIPREHQRALPRMSCSARLLTRSTALRKPGESSAAVPFPTLPTGPDRPTATGSPPATIASTSACGWSERCRPAQGKAPQWMGAGFHGLDETDHNPDN